ncbi:HNRNPA0 [Symbiodinium pilosum]|uniref:HNRNPA0 protein n=1 Tax=Symbiodinium pilosum TaxID=2952 RepID=A0A812W7R9_SYMPI|nr:HNRNPA0 [Symbiodinium pilosum]
MSFRRSQKADGRRRSGGDLIQSPSPSFNEVDAPSTPCKGSSQPKALVGSPSPLSCPQPRRPFPISPHPNGSPLFEQLSGVPAGTEEAANKELNSIWSGTSWKLPTGSATPGRSPWENRPLSSVSTNAGATPSLDDQNSRLQFSPAPSSAAPTPSLQDFDRYKAVPPSQVRKIFVGGIPQDFTQDDLCELFSQYGMVTKAWLQRHRQADHEFGATAQRSQSHRGFGFVIFQDASMVDDLLGPETSCFLEIKDGRRIEIKRAKSSNDIIGERQVSHPDVSKPVWSCKPSGQQLQSQTQQQPVQSAHFVPCARMNCGGSLPVGGWPMMWTGPVPASRAMLPAWGGATAAADNSQGQTSPQMQAHMPSPPPVPQILTAQVPPFSFPWAGAAQSEEDKQKLVQLLQAAAPANYED